MGQAGRPKPDQAAKLIHTRVCHNPNIRIKIFALKLAFVAEKCEYGRS